jgi:pantothenate kinase type III
VQSSNTLLLLDVGNSTVKWQVRRQNQIIAEGNGELEQSFLRGDYDLLISQVGLLPSFCEKLIAGAKHFHEVRVRPEWLPTVYDQPQRLGVDRWLPGLCIEAEMPTLVVDLGTAATLDFFAEGRHLGGWILPGIRTQWQALVAHTQFEKREMPSVINSDWAVDSESSMYNGIVFSLQAAIEAARHYQGRNWNLIVCGGDAETLALKGASVQTDLILSAMWQYWKRETLACVG